MEISKQKSKKSNISETVRFLQLLSTIWQFWRLW